MDSYRTRALDSTNHNDRQSIINLKDGENYRFLARHLRKHTARRLQSFTNNIETYQQKLSVIWSSLFSDFHKETATNQYALPSLSYPTWMQTWQINALKQIDRESRKSLKTMVEVVQHHQLIFITYRGRWAEEDSSL